MISRNNKFLWLEALRGFAAIWVLVHHADLTTSAFVGEIGSTFITRGLLGVDFFFILSGFIISYSSRRLIENGQGVMTYITSRILRIYLPYLPIGIGLYFAYFFLPGLSASNRDIGLLTSLTLFPTSEVTALSVAWTLKHEMLFYLLFSSLFFGKRVHFSVMVGWGLAIIGDLIWTLEFSSPLKQVLLHPLNLWFFVGIAIERLPREVGSTRSLSILAVVSLVALVLLVEMGLSNLYVGLTMTVLIFAITRQSVILLRVPKLFLFLGSASYSIYLVHNPIQSVIVRGWMSIGQGDVFSSFLAITLGSLAFGVIYYLMLERPFQAISRIILGRLSGPTVKRSSP